MNGRSRKNAETKNTFPGLQQENNKVSVLPFKSSRMYQPPWSSGKVSGGGNPACLNIRPRLVFRDHSVNNPETFKGSYPPEHAMHHNNMPDHVATSINIQQQMSTLRQRNSQSYGYLTTHSSSVLLLEPNDSGLSILAPLTAKSASTEPEAAKHRNISFLANIAAQKNSQQYL